MDSSLLTWADNAVAIDELLCRAKCTLDLLDHNLALQGWETLARSQALRTAIQDREVQVRLILNDTQSIASAYPRIFSLLKTLGHRLIVLQTRAYPKPEQFMAVADGQHCIFRPVLVRSRGFAYFDNAAKSNIYLHKVNVIWEFGGQRLFPEAFGL